MIGGIEVDMQTKAVSVQLRVSLDQKLFSGSVEAQEAMRLIGSSASQLPVRRISKLM